MLVKNWYSARENGYSARVLIMPNGAENSAGTIGTRLVHNHHFAGLKIGLKGSLEPIYIKTLSWSRLEP